MRSPAFIATLFLSAFFSTEALAQEVGQTRPMHPADSVRVLYQNLDYDAAERLALETLDSDDPLSIENRAELHFLVGLVNYVRSDSIAARADFETVLSLDPNYLPDPILVPPRVLAFFNRVRDGYRPEVSQEVFRIRYVMVHDMRPGAALRSAVLPGWGQIYRGDVGKGGVMAGAWIATAGTALTLSLLGNGNDDIRGVRIAAMSTAGIVWLYSYLDALLVPGLTSSDGVRLTPMVSPESVGVRTTLHF